MTSQRERNGQGARIATLLDELPPEARAAADEAVEDADDADELVDRLEDLAAAHEDSLDGSVREADSLADLVEADGSLSGTGDPRATEAKARDPGVGSDAGDAGPGTSNEDGSTGSSGPIAHLRSAVGSVLGGILGRRDETRSNTAGTDVGSLPATDSGEESQSRITRVRERTGAGIDRAKHTVANAEPSEAALWGLGAGLAVANPAIAAGYSTYVLLGGAVAGGVGLGAYKSSHDDTPLDGLNPLSLGREINRVTASDRSLEEIDPKTVGTVLGASTEAIEEITPEAYAQWAVRADPEAVFRGAQYGAEYAGEIGGRRPGVALGGGMGLLYGYAATDGDLQSTDPGEFVGAGDPGDTATGTDSARE